LVSTFILVQENCIVSIHLLSAYPIARQMEGGWMDGFTPHSIVGKTALRSRPNWNTDCKLTHTRTSRQFLHRSFGDLEIIIL